jgi:hypothetical protein
VSGFRDFKNGDRALNPEQQTEQLPKQREAGRKPKDQSRATELRQALVTWRQISEAARPSLRFLAAQLHTSHQLLNHFLGTLDDWALEERIRIAEARVDRMYASAEAEGRHLTGREVAAVTVEPHLLKMIAEVKREFESGPLPPHRIKMLRMFAKNFPEAQNLLQECLQDQRPRTKKPLELTAKQEEFLKTLSKANARRYKRWLADESPGDLDLS